jgi:hypothetical protein
VIGTDIHEIRGYNEPWNVWWMVGGEGVFIILSYPAETILIGECFQ